MHIIALKSAVIYGSWRDSRFYKIESFLHPFVKLSRHDTDSPDPKTCSNGDGNGDVEKQKKNPII